MPIFSVKYEYRGPKEVIVEADSVEDALLKSGVPETNQTRQAVELDSGAQNKMTNRVVYKDPRTGEDVTARKDFAEKLPTVLKKGERNAILVEDILARIGADVTEANRRQLRHAKEYLVIEKRMPICSLRSQVGGYFIATSPTELLEDASAYRAQAAGLINVAENLEALVVECFKTDETTIHNDN